MYTFDNFNNFSLVKSDGDSIARAGHSIKGVEIEVQEALPKPAEDRSAGLGEKRPFLHDRFNAQLMRNTTSVGYFLGGFM